VASRSYEPLYSPDGHPIACALGTPTPKVATIAVELIYKWYHLILIKPDGAIEKMEFPDMGLYEDLGSPWLDHCPNPAHVVAYAREHDYYVDNMSLELIIGRWTLEHDGVTY
jgi:hypothetical protein